MIVEGVVTTLDSEDKVNVAPMGPIVDPSMSQFVLRPFQTSTTFKNLKTRPFGVFHIVDDVLLIAQSALDRLEQIPESFAAERITGRVLANCCRWYEFKVTDFDETSERTSLTAIVIHAGRLRDSFGFNRAKHAVLEATIVATRLHLVSESEVRQQLSALAIPVEKTAGPQELAAFSLVLEYVEEWYVQKRKSNET